MLAYADDIVLLGEDKKSLKELTGRILATEKWVGLEINVYKTEYMIVPRIDTRQHTL